MPVNPGSDLQDFLVRHVPIRGREEIQEAVNNINSRINGCGFYFQWDIRGDSPGFTSYKELPDDTIVVISSFDFSYYYDLEIAFHDVLRQDLPYDAIWPDHWDKDQIILLPEAETQAFMEGRELPYDSSYYLFGFNRGSHSDLTYLILAKGFSYHFGTVFYYNRLAQDRLQEGQRIAWWVYMGSLR